MVGCLLSTGKSAFGLDCLELISIETNEKLFGEVLVC